MIRLLFWAVVLVGLGSPAAAGSLHDAVGASDIDQVQKLIDHGEDFNEVDRRGNTPLHVAALRGHLEIAEFLISKGAEVNAKTRGLEWTPLHMAALSGHEDVAILLVANQAEIDASSSTGNTPLHEAAGKGHITIVELLVSNGADVNAKNRLDSPPMHLAGRADHLDIVDYLIGEGTIGAPVELVAGYLKTASAEAGRLKFASCRNCHSTEEGEQVRTGPNLGGVLDRRKASLETYEYSRALSRLEGIWTYEELNAFLASPWDFVPGTSMGDHLGFVQEDVKERADLISYLREISENPPPLPK